MANEIKDGRLHIDGQRIPLSMDEARSMKMNPVEKPLYTEDEYKAAEDVYGRMRTAQSMAMDSLMPSDKEFQALNKDAYAAVTKDVAEREAEAKRQECLKKAEELSSRIIESTESPLAEYGIY